ncbi:MAG: dTDP-4-dehydrorhamnose 3,5-epimerase [Bacteroidota bacterium]|jgi:dTDP-4-dehydrorhamnose 3,5-epimerase
MQVEYFSISGLIKFVPNIFEDERGCFMEQYNAQRYEPFLPISFIQDNISQSHRGVLRGLHFQTPPFAQGKLVQVLKGSVLDVAVDLRLNSSTYGQHEIIELSDKNRTQFYIPEGFAHGFIALEDHTLFSYKCTNVYSAEHERTLLWNDPMLGIEWPDISKIVSPKDQEGILLKNLNNPF